MDNYNYPAGADTPDAPWNQSEPSKRDFEVTIIQTLSKNVTVSTSDYAEEEDWDDDLGKCMSVDTTDTNWRLAYQENHETIESLLTEFAEMLRVQIESLESDVEIDIASPKDKQYLKRLKYLKSECENWCVDDFEVVQ